MIKKLFSCCLLVASVYQFALASPLAGERIVVDKNGKGDFRTISEALLSLDSVSQKQRTIFIRNGRYEETIFITKNNIILDGESREGVIITQSIARDIWRCSHPTDWGTATVNIDADDISLINMTVQNTYGFENQEDLVIDCPTDSLHQQKTVLVNGHQMALRTFSGTRLKAVNVHFKAYGGDTVSPWNVSEGMVYFKDCTMEGGVDFYCPRGWAYAENCVFIAHTGTASIWHDGSANEDSKTVLKNCSFEGFDGFNLGRYHRDAQFYLISCEFANNMADKDIYLVPTDNIIQWGRRIYYSDCHRVGGDFSWFANNISTAKGSPSTKEINASWTFKGQWNPESLNTKM